MGGAVTPERVLAASPEVLAASGLSRAKAASIRDLADKVMTGQVSLDRIGRLSDEEVVDHLTQVRGIGPWTAQMFLLGTLGRLDVWPTGDYGVRAGFAAGLGPGRHPDAPRSCSPWASPSVPTGAWWPGTAGGCSTTGGRLSAPGPGAAQPASVPPCASRARRAVATRWGAMRSCMPGGPHDPGG